jgi:MFS family permease
LSEDQLVPTDLEGGVVAAPPAGRVKPWEAFKIVEFRYLWGNSFSFALIQSTERFAFVWLMLEVYGKANQAGRITFVLGIPVLFFSLHAGVLADRLDRRFLLMATQGAAATVSLLLALLLYADALTYTLTIVLALLLGVTLAFGSPVRLSTIPTVVPKHTLMNAIVLNGFAQNISSIVGPALGGLVIGLIGVKGAFTMSTALYVIGILFLIPLRLPRVSASLPGATREKGAIRAGLRFIVGHPGIRGLFLFLAIAAIFLIGPYGVLVPQVARVRLNREVFEASLLFTALGAGSIVSTILQASLGDLKHKGRAFLIVVSCCGAMLATVGLSTSYPLTIALMFVWGIAGGFFMNLIQTLIQSNTPHEFLGRVASVQTLAMQGVTPFGALIAGWGADTFQITTWLMFSGVCMVGAAILVAVTQPAFRRM